MSLSAMTLHAAPSTVKHTIKSGDSLYTIAHKYHTSVEKIQQSNHVKKGEVLKLGRVLTIPSSSANQKIVKNVKKVNAKPVSYVIKKGDTLFGIARKHQTSIGTLSEMNGIKKGQALKLGEVIKIPQNASRSKQVLIAKKSQTLQNERKAIKALAMKAKQENHALKKAIASHSAPLAAQHAKPKSEKFSLKDILFKSSSKKKMLSRNTPNSKSTKIVELAKTKLGHRYVWGATGNQGAFDCSGLTTYVCKQNGICLPRRAIAQSKVGKKVSRDELKKGDLVFFDTSKSRRGYVNHVGIYIGDGKFIHASSAKHKVIITNLDKTFYGERFKGARRVVPASHI